MKTVRLVIRVLVHYFRVRKLMPLFLAGSAFGWIGEGFVVQTAFESLPLSISFTGFAYWLSDWTPVEEFSADLWPTQVVSVLFLLHFFFVTIPAQPLAALIQPLLLGMVYLGLRWNRHVEPERSDSYVRIVPVWKYACLLSIPVCAVAVYIGATLLDLHWRQKKTTAPIKTEDTFLRKN